jgi:hypothetical protein
MYSIYDTYGMQNDLENRYTAAKSAGTPTGSTRPPSNNSPFSTEIAQAQPSLAGSPLQGPVTQQIGSIYEDQMGNGGYGSQPGLLDSNYQGGMQMPGSDRAGNTMLGLFTTGLGMANPVAGAVGRFGGGLFSDYANDKLSWGSVARSGLNAVLGLVNPGAQFNKALGIIGLPGMVTSKAVNTGSKYIMNSSKLNGIIDWITGRPSLTGVRGDWFEGPENQFTATRNLGTAPTQADAESGAWSNNPPGRAVTDQEGNWTGEVVSDNNVDTAPANLNMWGNPSWGNTSSSSYSGSAANDAGYYD